MLATHPPLNCVISENFQNPQRRKTMKNGNKNDHLVFTLEDDISDQVLKSKNDEDTTSGSSSVALWIKSLKENNVAFEDSNQDYHGYTGSSSDQDDLQLGEEATDIRRKQKNHKHPVSFSRDSDSDSSYNKWYSWTGRRSFLTNHLSYDRSLDSDTSGFSSVTSVSSLLTARESDPEDVLKGLGFRASSVLDKIPDRFINTGTICDGVNSDQFLCSVQDDCEDAMPVNSEIPPWVMARFDEIPRKFWNQKDDPPVSTDAGQGSPLINEPSSDEANEDTPSRHPKTFPSKFGTYLEPVTEEAELSSQGSFTTLSPMKTASFESTRSTLKANSQDDPENVAKIPSLCDLWQTTEDEEEIDSEAMRSKEHGIFSDDTGNSMPGGHLPEGNITWEVDQGCNGDWIDKNRNNIPVSPWSSTPAIADIQGTTTEVVPAITSGQWSDDTSVPALSFYLTENDAPVSENLRDLSQDESEPTNNRCPEVTDNDKMSKANAENDSKTFLTQKHPSLSIPIVTVSGPVEKSRKISTVDAPDLDKLLPLLWLDKADVNTQSNDNNAVENSSKGKVSCNIRQTKATQFNFYGTQKWATVENKGQPQIQFANKEKAKGARKSSMRNRKTADTKVTLSVSQCRRAKQVTMISNNCFERIPCFTNLDVENSYKRRKTCSETSKASTIQNCGGSETSKTSKTRTEQCFRRSETFKRQERTFTSLPLQQTENPSVQWHFNQSESANEVDYNAKKSSKGETQGEGKDIDSEGQISLKNEECLGAGIDDSKNKYGARLNKGMSIEEELDGLQNSLKGVKMYKAGIHLMQLASSVETVMCSEKRPKRLQERSSGRLLDSIQKELKHLEEYILRLQKQLKGIKKQSDEEETSEEVHRRGSDFSDITRQLLQEQLKMFTSISSAAVSPTSTPSRSRAESLCSETPDVLRHTDVMKLRKEMQQLRQDSQEQSASMKEEILGEVRAEIRQCFKEFLQTKSE